MHILQKFFGEIDVFSAPPLLRARKQQQTSSYTSGILSLAMAILFIYVFGNGLYQVVTYSQINSVQTDTKLSGQQVQAKGLYFAVRVGYLTINDSLSNFNIAVIAYSQDGSRINVDLQPCNSEKWSSIGDKYLQQFNQYSLGNFFCPVSSEKLNIKKVFYAPGSTSIQIIVSKCLEGPYCNNISQQEDFVQQKQDKQGAIFMLVYFLDSLISPSDRDPIILTINTDVELSFTNKRGIIGTIQMGTYKVTTDVGYFPVAQTQQLNGNYVNDFRQTYFQIVNQTQNYALIYISMNRRFISIERTVGKFDVLLSYAGGLFAIITGFLRFFMYSYNRYRYQLMVAQGFSSSDDNGNSIHQDQLSFYRYVKYTIFDWVNTLFCHQIGWEDCKLIDEARQQASSQLDVTNLFRKINSFEVALEHLLQDNEKQCLTLMKPQNLNKIRRDRLILEYYSTVMNGQPATTVQQYKTAQTLLLFSIKIYEKSKLEGHNKHLSDNEKVKQNALSQSRKSQSIDQIIKIFPDMIHAAQQIQLDPEMNQIQNQLTQAFYNLNTQTRLKIQRKIPIKILIRLRRKYQMHLKNQSQSSQSRIGNQL